MRTRVKPCAACGETKTIRARGWCSACYSRWLAHGKPESGPPPRRVIPCGTPQGYDRHVRQGERSCAPCRRAHAAVERQRYGGRKVPLAPCGTEAGYQRHVHHGEEPCDPCRDARNACQRARYAAGPYALNKKRHRTQVPTEWTKQQESAARLVASLARDADDCRGLLATLGLLPDSTAGQMGGAA